MTIPFKEFASKYPNFSQCSIQWFDDDKTRADDTMAGHAPVEGIDWGKVRLKIDQGCGVFFSVNPMIKGQRNKNSVTGISAWVAESDTISKEEQMALINAAPLPPSMIIESKSSYHIYYFAEDGDKENRETVERGLAHYYNGDESFTTNFALVLRLPGSLHQKKPLEKFKIECIKLDEDYYSQEDMIKNFPIDESKLKKKASETKVVKPLSLSESNNIWEFMASLGNEYMLSRLSGSVIVSGKSITFKDNAGGTRQIFTNGESSSSWIDNKGFIGSSTNRGPTWIQWCQHYGGNKSSILKWFYDYCDDLIPPRFDRTKKQIELDKVVDEHKREAEQEARRSSFQHIDYKTKIERGFAELMQTDPNQIMKFGRKEFDDLLGGIYGGKIYLVGAETGTGKSSFVNQIANNLAETGVRVTRYSLEDRMEDSAKEDLFYGLNRYRASQGKKKVEWIPFLNGEYFYESSSYYDMDVLVDLSDCYDDICAKEITELDKQKDVGIEDLVNLMEEECDKGTRVFIVDHLHYFKYEGTTGREDLQLENAMKQINEIARKRNVAVFLVAHYSSGGVKDGKTTLNSFKGSSAIKQIANVIIQISRELDHEGEETGRTIFRISKLRGPLKKNDIIGIFNLATFEYDFTITDQQRKKSSEYKEQKKSKFKISQ